ncbi:MAG: hypothetical protein V4850_35445 [Myxococcota bacterium]
MFHRLAALLVLAACTGGASDKDDTGGETGGGDTDTPECDEIVPPGFDVWLTGVGDAVIGPEDVRWNLGDTSGYCSLESDGRFHCDTGGASGAAELFINISGAHPVSLAVEIEEFACLFPQILVTLEHIGAAFAEDRAYFIQWIEDEEECANSWELYFMNCYATAVFCADGDAEVILSDIINSGIYGTDGFTITGSFPDGSGEIADDETFAIESETTIRDTTNGLEWTLDTEGRFAPYVCREGGA